MCAYKCLCLGCAHDCKCPWSAEVQIAWSWSSKPYPLLTTEPSLPPSFLKNVVLLSSDSLSCPRLISTSWQIPCLGLLSVGITGMHHCHHQYNTFWSPSSPYLFPSPTTTSSLLPVLYVRLSPSSHLILDWFPFNSNGQMYETRKKKLLVNETDSALDTHE